MKKEELLNFQFQQIGIIHSCYREKFGIPRQAGIVTASESELELLPPFHQENLIRGLEGFSHIWVLFVFHKTMKEGWRATVRPPRLNGRQRVGVFATRSTHRPNPIGISAVALKGIRLGNGKLILELEGADLLDGTPVIDIKPYLPYADVIPDALNGFAPQPITTTDVFFSDHAATLSKCYEKNTGRQLITLIKQVLSQDPRPAYLRNTTNRRHYIALWDIHVIWESRENFFLVIDIENQKS
ncbi:MAG: tRNA (N6-threonylcarbamoyladenosine(37)-N6)-methyltransferase TrmO [Candidatus Endonucleobacter bathymodioli]|uniref:tRNA (N6-threonylcarbamoyladenosine(37)-N6)-methyltransferase TrmO n=1 Tax=Candidatus Endonucleibacter bathymodioli TaxID=539814 RepID=A0AA90NL88_9GAMM|nr:tRNA (N6-threonylcarbamoyladenosine(37)-N6)-methyltransferase TrmO [Candidatus Endonucleobacter bathymodioli]